MASKLRELLLARASENGVGKEQLEEIAGITTEHLFHYVSANRVQNLKIVGLDIETTGFDGKDCDLLEIGLVLYDFQRTKGVNYSQLNDMVSKVRIIVHRPTSWLRGGLGAFEMHSNTLLPLHKRLDKCKNQEDKDEAVYELQQGSPSNLNNYITSPNLDDIFQVILQVIYNEGWINQEEYNTSLEKGKLPSPLTVAGKNVVGFDLKFLEDNLKGFRKVVRIRQRAFDPTVFFTNPFADELPDLGMCLEIAQIIDKKFPKRSEVFHTAVEDAMDVIYLIHYARLNNLLALSKLISF